MTDPFKPDLSPQNKTAIDLHKSFLVANAQAYAMHNARAFEDAAKFARQAIRGLFLLHGACATAVIATGMIAKLKGVLLLLGTGVLCSVATACCAFFLHRKIAEQDKTYNDDLLRDHLSVLHRVIFPDIKVKDSDIKSICKLKYHRCFWFYAMVFFGGSSIVLFICVLYCFYKSVI